MSNARAGGYARDTEDSAAEKQDEVAKSSGSEMKIERQPKDSLLT